jgi:hypothetical protein
MAQALRTPCQRAQDTQSGKNLAHPILIYSWWITAFELFGILYSAYVILAAPAKKLGAAGIVAVLTASTFIFLHELYVGDAATFAAAIEAAAAGRDIVTPIGAFLPDPALVALL